MASEAWSSDIMNRMFGRLAAPAGAWPSASRQVARRIVGIFMWIEPPNYHLQGPV